MINIVLTLWCDGRAQPHWCATGSSHVRAPGKYYSVVGATFRKPQNSPTHEAINK